MKQFPEDVMSQCGYWRTFVLLLNFLFSRKRRPVTLSRTDRLDGWGLQSTGWRIALLFGNRREAANGNASLHAVRKADATSGYYAADRRRGSQKNHSGVLL